MMKPNFNAIEYFSQIVNKSLPAKAAGFRFATCSGISMLQQPLDEFQQYSSFVVFDDTTSGRLFRNGGGWFLRQNLTLFFISRYDFGSEQSRSDAMALCREMALLFASRMLRDEEDFSSKLIYMQTENIIVKELGEALGNNCTGLFLMIDVDEPVDLCYNDNLWTE